MMDYLVIWQILLIECFPDKTKIAKITPIFKSGEKDLMKNYRPISILPAFSKIVERIIYNRVYSYVTNNLLLHDEQFGFQHKCSTEYAILLLTKGIKESYDEQKYIILVFS